MSEPQEFFLVALPGLESIVLNEAREWYPDLTFTEIHGGVSVTAPLAVGLSMNQVLKTPTRILVRVASFMCRDFPKLYNKTFKFEWSQWIDASCTLTVHVSTARSRIKMKKRIESTVSDAWLDYQKKNKIRANQEKSTGLYVRLHDNECVFSLDTSGERLHKRGQRKNIGEAPLRETIAAALLQMLARDAPSEPVELIDPMMGSGTFLLEALQRDQEIQRDFNAKNFAVNPAAPPKLKAARPRIDIVIGFEHDGKTLGAARSNLGRLRTNAKIELRNEDFFKATPLAKSPRQRWIVANPPYGERLKVSENLSDYYAKLFAQAEAVARPDRACFLLPSKVGRLMLPPEWKVLEKRPFLNGGIPVVAFVMGRR